MILQLKNKLIFKKRRRSWASTAWGMGLIPGWGTKIPRAGGQKIETNKQIIIIANIS